MTAELEEQRARTREAVAAYRKVALLAEPRLPPELVTGETLEEVERSLQEARRVVRLVRERQEEL